MVEFHSMRSEMIRFLAEPVMRMLFRSGALRTSRQVPAAIAVAQTTAMAMATVPSGRRSTRRASRGGWVSVGTLIMLQTGLGENRAEYSQTGLLYWVARHKRTTICLS